MECNTNLHTLYSNRTNRKSKLNLSNFRILRHRKVNPNIKDTKFCCHCEKDVAKTNKQSWRGLFNLASVAGFQRVSQATSAFWIFLWAMLLVAGLICTARDVYTVTLQFLDYPVLTTLTLDQEASLPFPAVTVCSLNRVHCSNLRRVVANNWGTELGTRLLHLHDLTDCQLHFGKRRERSAATNSRQGSSAARNLTTEPPLLATTEGPKPANQTRTFNDLMHFMAVYANFSTEVRSEMGHSFEEFIRSCTFSGESCLNNSLFFNQQNTNGYGNCFTFRTFRKSVIPGKDYGLSMEIYLDQANYLRAGLSPQAGARVVVHDRDHEALPEESGISVSPNAATSVALLEVQVNRLEVPYQSNCTVGWEKSGYEHIVQGAFAYSAQRCQRVCLQLAFEETCQCSHPAYMDLDQGYPPCNLTSGTPGSECATRVVTSFEGRVRSCSCNMDCHEITYETTISTAAWPTDSDWCTTAQRLQLVESCNNADQEFGGDHRKKERQRIQGNLLKVDVYLQSLRVRSVSQTPAIPPEVFVASLGGALSLYLGLSLLSLLEIAGLIIHLLSNSFKNIAGYFSFCKFQWKHKAPRVKQGIIRGQFTPPHNSVSRRQMMVW